MIVALHLAVQPGSRAMLTHKFKIGQHLFPVRHTAENLPAGAYVVIKRLPKRNGEFEYEIRSINELCEKVAREGQLRMIPRQFV
jgi:hypothetical protein